MWSLWARNLNFTGDATLRKTLTLTLSIQNCWNNPIHHKQTFVVLQQKVVYIFPWKCLLGKYFSHPFTPVANVCGNNDQQSMNWSDTSNISKCFFKVNIEFLGNPFTTNSDRVLILGIHLLSIMWQQVDYLRKFHLFLWPTTDLYLIDCFNSCWDEVPEAWQQWKSSKLFQLRLRMLDQGESHLNYLYTITKIIGKRSIGKILNNTCKRKRHNPYLRQRIII